MLVRRAAGTASPTGCTVDGAACGGGGTTTMTTRPTTTTSPPTTAPTTTTRPPTTTTSPTTTSRPTTTTSPPGGSHVLAGYLHASFANGSGYARMRDVPAEWDVINLAFGEPTSPTSGNIQLRRCPASECPTVETDAEFLAAIRDKQAQGKKVLISIGGANGQVRLGSAAARDAFVGSVAAIIDRYGLDGLDIDFEGHSLFLDAGDTDFRNPTTPVVVNLISALRPDQVAIGLPASPLAANGFTPVAAVQQALDCLIKGQTCGGSTLRAGPKPSLRGLMAWSVNWDRFNGFEFSRSHRAYFNRL